MSIQRAYPRLIGGIPEKTVNVPYVGVMEMQKIINQMCDWIFQSGGGGGGGGSSSAQRKQSDAQLILTAAFQDIPNCSLTLSAGTWVIIGSFDLTGRFDTGASLGALTVDGVLDDSFAVVNIAALVASLQWSVNVSQTWLKTVSGGTVVKLQASVGSPSGGESAVDTTTSITAFKVG